MYFETLTSCPSLLFACRIMDRSEIDRRSRIANGLTKQVEHDKAEAKHTSDDLARALHFLSEAIQLLALTKPALIEAHNQKMLIYNKQSPNDVTSTSSEHQAIYDRFYAANEDHFNAVKQYESALKDFQTASDKLAVMAAAVAHYDPRDGFDEL